MLLPSLACAHPALHPSHFIEADCCIFTAANVLALQSLQRRGASVVSNKCQLTISERFGRQSGKGLSRRLLQALYNGN
jgi:hypothetical protein